MEKFFLMNIGRKNNQFVMYTEEELRTIDRNFGHLSIKSMVGLLKRTENEKKSEITKEAIADLAERCEI